MSVWLFNLLFLKPLKVEKCLKGITAYPHIQLFQGYRENVRECMGSSSPYIGSYFPYILLNEIQMMASQLAKQSARVLPADLCTDNAHYVKNHISMVYYYYRERRKTWRSKAGLFPIIIFWEFANLFILSHFSDILCGFLFLLNNFPLQSLENAT